MTVSLPTTAIIGTGSMGGAILSGLLSPAVTVDGQIRVTNRSAAKAAALQSPAVISTASETDPRANLLAVTGARIVVVAVKPAMVAEVLREIAPALAADAIVISVAAGVNLTTMEVILPGAVLRAMPNTPATVGRAVTGLSAGTRVSAQQLALASALFETVGTVITVPEHQIDALSTVSGSGPAYVFLLIEALTGSAMRMGFTESDARLMVENTFLGAAELLAAGDLDPRELRRRVTSPNGTTERAIAVLEGAELGGVFDRATAAALARARELAAG
ncbi:MAG: pyrroline-5-carboxylate reductase [Microbacteriaceae bacterium]|nr:pyrroline-5-carboxylate reductase [Microbacteriaceae bacterium]